MRKLRTDGGGEGKSRIGAGIWAGMKEKTLLAVAMAGIGCGGAAQPAARFDAETQGLHLTVCGAGPARAEPATAEEQITILRTIADRGHAGRNMPGSKSATESARDALIIAEVLKTLDGDEPGQDDPKRAVYLEAISRFDGRAEAVDAIRLAHVKVIKRLYGQIGEGDIVQGGGNELIRMLKGISTRGYDRPGLYGYSQAGEEIAVLVSRLQECETKGGE